MLQQRAPNQKESKPFAVSALLEWRSGAVLSIRASSTSVVTSTVIDFLKDVPPFQFLPASELSRLVPSMTLEYFPKDDTIISAGHRPSEVLYIGNKGAVELALRTRVRKQLVFDLRWTGKAVSSGYLVKRNHRSPDAWS